MMGSFGNKQYFFRPRTLLYVFVVPYLPDQVGENDFPGLKVSIRELDDVLLRDVGNRIKDSEK